jgi:hypothetical protein
MTELLLLVDNITLVPLCHTWTKTEYSLDV